MAQKIAACMILGDQFNPEELMRTFHSLYEGGIDRLFIAYNGENFIVPELYLEFEDYSDLSLKIKQFIWMDDFATARNQSFSMVNPKEFDWIMWIDSDDVLVVEEGTLKDLVESIDDDHQGIFLRYDYAVEPETGQVVVEQWRERLFRSNVDWTWKHPIHEVCYGPPGTAFVRKRGVALQHMRQSGEDRGARTRNRRIIAKAIREHPDVPRYAFYFAGETMAEADTLPPGKEKKELAQAAVLAFDKFKEMLDELNDDFYVAQIRIAECYRMAEMYAEAYEADLEAIGVYPDWPDAYIGASKTCMEMGDFSRMLSFANIASRLSKPNTSASIESMNYGFTPVFLKAIANENLGNIDQAIAEYTEANVMWPGANQKIQEKIAELEAFDPDYVPPADLDRKRLKNTKPQKSIAFLTTPLPEDWHPELMKINGSGGAELCIMKLAPYFAADGYRVAVFGTPGPYRGVYEGVEYWNSNEYAPHERYKYLVSSRTTVPFTMECNSDKRVLWMHDVNSGPDLLDVKDAPDKILCLTNWHKSHVSKLYGIDPSQIEVVPNGIDIDRFDNFDANRPLGQKFIWSSSYDRGLETMLGLWPSIKKMLPESSLDIFYGWNFFDKSIEQWKRFNEAQAKALIQFRYKIEQLMLEAGIESYAKIDHHGRINQNDLAGHMKKMDIWAYPTQFMETFCITGVEMQAAGVIPIASNLAALTENIAAKELLITGWPQNVSYQQQLLDRIESVYSAPKENIAQIRQEGRKLAESFTWDNAYNKWRDVLSAL